MVYVEQKKWPLLTYFKITVVKIDKENVYLCTMILP